MQHESNRPLVAALSTLLLTACALGAEDGAGGESATSSSGATSGSATAGPNASSSSTGFLTSTVGSGGGVALPAEVFGHSKSTLYKLDPDTKAVGIVAPFNGCPDVTDIALDKDSRLIASADTGLYQVDKNTGACTLIAMGAYPNSLSFVPEGTVDPNVEALVGYVAVGDPERNQFVRIDPTTGAITNIGAPWNDDLVSSGDIVSVIDGPTYLTVKRGMCSTSDCLVEINPVDGQIKRFLGPIGFQKVFGMAFWAGKAFGFTSDGKLFDIVVDAGGMVTTSLIPTQSGLQFWGAGSTTKAPVVPQ